MKEVLKKAFEFLNKYSFAVLGFIFGLIVINSEIWVYLYKLTLLVLFTYLGYKIGINLVKVKKIIKVIISNFKYTVEDIKDVYYEIDINNYETNYNNNSNNDENFNNKSNLFSNIELDDIKEYEEENLKQEKQNIIVKVNDPKKNENKKDKNNKEKNNKEKNNNKNDKTKLEDYSDEEIKVIDEAFEIFKEINLDDEKLKEVDTYINKISESENKSETKSKSKTKKITDKRNENSKSKSKASKK